MGLPGQEKARKYV